MTKDYKSLAAAIVNLSIDMVEAAKSGHPGAPLGMSDFLTVLFAKYLKFSAAHPEWPNRDRFILSNGHASAALYSLLYLCGYEKPEIADLKNFRQLGSCCAGHPEFGHLAGVEVTTGPLGQGFANAVGMAIASKKSQAQFGTELIDHKIYVTMGDGCMMEGISHEAASLAGHLKLNNLIALFDSNHISIDGDLNLTDSTNIHKRFEAYHWNILKADGHNYEEIDQALAMAQLSDKPTLIIFDTVIAHHANVKRGLAASHGAPLGQAEVDFIKQSLNLNSEPFVIDAEILAAWRKIGAQHYLEYIKWKKTLNNHPLQSEFNKDLPKDFNEKMTEIKASCTIKDESTRKSSGAFLEQISKIIPNFLGGSADLSESNCVITHDAQIFNSHNYNGNYIHYGVREHAMAAIMNGIVAYGLHIPFGGGFVIFSDYCKPSIRLAALMGLQVIHVLTHDSIGLGEDGPTHQPIEQLAGLRTIPNILVFRPADAMETIACWEIALQTKDKPSVLILSRQNLKQLTNERLIQENLIKEGAYILKDYIVTNASKKLLIIATGSELELSMDVYNRLSKEGKFNIRIVSMPCMNSFARQSDLYKKHILEADCKVAIEAACEFGWHKYIGEDGLFFGITDQFGASGKATDLYKYFGLEADAIVKKINNQFL